MTDAKIINKCGQPKGTLIETAIKNGRFQVSSREIVPIENLKVGDYISSYHFTDSAIYARLLVDIEKETYRGKIIKASVDGNVSLYPINHTCLVRYRDMSHNYCVYIMRKGKAFRVGMSKIWHNNNGAGPYKRLVDEDADEGWILKVFPTRRDALLEECKISIKFRIPQAMFKYKETRGSWTQEEFDYVWSEVDNYEDAKQAIEYYQRDIDYPYFDRSKKHTSMKRPHEVKACNILKNSEMIVRGKKWMNVELSEDYYDGDVYILTVDKNDNYFANNILTHA